MAAQKLFVTIKYLFVAFSVLFSFAAVYAYTASDYYSFLLNFLLSTERTKEYIPLLQTDPYFTNIHHPFSKEEYESLANNAILQVIYSVVKFELVFLLGLLLFWIHDLMTAGKTRLSIFVHRILRGLTNSIIQNFGYVKAWKPFIKWSMGLLFLIQAIFLLFFLLNIPFEYDEMMSYFCFSSRSFLQTATFYPFPNNHILYSHMATLFAHLPLSPAITTRIPSFLFYFMAEYYFFKLSRRYFSDAISLVITTLYTVSYPVIFYAIMARGYTFMYCFTILLFYAADNLVADPGSRKYRALYFFSMLAAVYTIPSCLFILFGMGLAVSSYYLYTRRWQVLIRFVLDNCLIIICILLLYLPIVLCNGLSKISDPTGAPHLSLRAAFSAAYPLFERTWTYLARGFYLPLLAIIPLILAAFYAGGKKDKNAFGGWMTGVMLISPILIFFLHRVETAERVHGYLIVPICLSAGFLLSLLLPYAKRGLDRLKALALFFKWKEQLLLCWMVLLTVLLFATYRSYHQETRPVVYFADNLFRKIGHDMEHIQTIGYTPDYFSEYICECILMRCYMLDPEKKFELGQIKPGVPNDAEIRFPDGKDSLRSDQYTYLNSYYFYQQSHVDAYLRKR
ncbi:hypothetical protein ACX0G9_26820 [Flavitalea flava]